MSATYDDLIRERRYDESPRHPPSTRGQATKKAGPHGEPAPAGAWAGRLSGQAEDHFPVQTVWPF